MVIFFVFNKIPSKNDKWRKKWAEKPENMFFFNFHFLTFLNYFLVPLMTLSIKKAPARWIGGKKTHESDSYVWKIWWFWPKNRQKSGFLPLHFNWQLMAMVFDPNFGKNMNNWYITKERNVASLRQTPKFWLRGIFDPKISKKVDFFN